MEMYWCKKNQKVLFVRETYIKRIANIRFQAIDEFKQKYSYLHVIEIKIFLRSLESK